MSNSNRFVFLGVILGLTIGFVAGYIYHSTTNMDKNKVTFLQYQIDNLESQVSSLEYEINKLNNEVSNLGSTLQDKENELTILTDELSDANNQILQLQEEISNKSKQIDYLESLLEQPKEGGIEIYDVKWEVNNHKVRIFIRNSEQEIFQKISIESVTIKKNMENETWFEYKGFILPLFSGDSEIIVMEEGSSDNDLPSGFIDFNQSYLIRVTCDTGDYDEVTASTPTV